MFPGRPARRWRPSCVAALILAAVFALPAASASALTVEGAVADALAGSSGAPAGTVLTMFVEADPGTRVPRAVSFTVGQGLLLGASGPSCDIATIRALPVSLPAGLGGRRGGPWRPRRGPSACGSSRCRPDRSPCGSRERLRRCSST
ncbi:hypothetical protein LRS13_04170 [Svornostia abyssi]|uniref:CHRD domain-containing protein n=1 Tax=Svornostia abyssi TaxID=2898438 RepID=A0ABY5PJ73_9ACTN|nr:hypothetical protein LRS13_04170 [Parviterribacteraceae bacterium J379]